MTAAAKHKKYMYKGELLTLPELAKKVNISRSTLFTRLVTNKWSLERAITEPLKKNQHAVWKKNH